MIGEIKVKRYKSILKIGKDSNLIIKVDVRFNKLQKRVWKCLLNVDIEDVEE